MYTSAMDRFVKRNPDKVFSCGVFLTAGGSGDVHTPAWRRRLNIKQPRGRGQWRHGAARNPCRTMKKVSFCFFAASNMSDNPAFNSKKSQHLLHVRSFVHELRFDMIIISPHRENSPFPLLSRRRKNIIRNISQSWSPLIEREELIVVGGNSAGELFSASRDEERLDEATGSAWTPLTPQLCISLSVWSAVEDAGLRCFVLHFLQRGSLLLEIR